MTARKPNPDGPKERGFGRWLPGVLLAGLLPFTVAASEARSPHADGDPVVVTGLVTDPDGAPLADLQVVLKASRANFNFLEMRRVERDSTRVSTRSDSRGEYSLRWPWDRYYNRFEILVGIPIRRADGESLRVFEQIDITRRILRESPVVVTVVVEESAALRRLREFLSTIRSEDQRRTYEEMGQPDRVETVNYPTHQEISWWYFESGRAFRFRDGQLQRVVRFEPVERFQQQ